MTEKNGGTPKPAILPGTVTHITQLLDFEPDAFGIPDKWDSLDETIEAERHQEVRASLSTLPTKIEGPESLQKRIKKVLEEFTDIFRRDVSDTPAEFGEAYTIQIDEEQWKRVKGNYMVPPRRQSEEKEAEIKRQIDILTKRNVIRIAATNVDRYSQVHLVKKSNGGHRMTIDFVGLNSACKGESWNLPNIKEMLYRIGSKRPKFFAVMDLTSGYHQAPLAKSSMRHTAFITYMGLFEWIRLPMGLKGAASYFQKMLATVVLIGLIHRICELYIDDIITHAQTEDDFIDNLTEIFTRFRRHNVTLNPDKCKFGMSEVEYVGHKIDSTGIAFMPEKLEAVLTKEPPVYPKDMKSLLGLLSWFRDHIQGFASITKPMQDMINGYDKKSTRKLVWSEKARAAYQLIRERIRTCPKLFFVDRHLPIQLHTDASDFGIGAFLSQLSPEGETIPIGSE